MKIITLISFLNPFLENKILKQLAEIILSILTARGRITMLGLSRWSSNISYQTINRFFHSSIDWDKINWTLIKKYLKNGGVWLLVGDEVVVSKSGKKTYGLGYYFSSLQNQVIKSIAFLNLSLVSVETGKAYSILTKQIIKTNSDGCPKKKFSSNKKSKKIGKKSKTRGRKKGSKNKNKADVELSAYLLFVQTAILRVLSLINNKLKIVYFVFDGEFGYNSAVEMVKQTGLQFISKLRRDSALFFPYKGEYSGKGAPKKYDGQLDYDDISDKDYLKETTEDGDIETKFYQMNMLHKNFANMLNIVIIKKRNIKTDKESRVVLFSTDLDLSYDKVVKYYSLRFQIEFVFRDAKQYWGLEDFMNTKKIAVHNWSNFSTFMVNFVAILKKEKFKNSEMSSLDLKAHYHGIYYVDTVLKLLPKKPDNILIKTLYEKISTIGAIYKYKEAV